jgi:hypothetical protein
MNLSELCFIAYFAVKKTKDDMRWNKDKHKACPYVADIVIPVVVESSLPTP